jgi:hypothetical protein
MPVGASTGSTLSVSTTPLFTTAELFWLGSGWS